jgi:UDP-N-acetylmuramoyl-tripeptide--D-alanyl-D-alanine ligase
MKQLGNALTQHLRGGYAETAAELTPALIEGLQGGDVIMVKGSNGSKAGLIVKTLLALEE